MQLSRNRIFLIAASTLLLALASVPTIVDDSNNSTAKNLSLEQIIQNSEKLQGEEVAVNGTAATFLACTQIACEPENPCCNSCSGNLILEDGNHRINLDFENSTGSCSGNNCNIDCQPLKKDEEYVLRGIIGKSDSRPVLEVTEYRQL